MPRRPLIALNNWKGVSDQVMNGATTKSISRRQPPSWNVHIAPAANNPHRSDLLLVIFIEEHSSLNQTAVFKQTSQDFVPARTSHEQDRRDSAENDGLTPAGKNSKQKRARNQSPAHQPKLVRFLH